jgi:hypothetical protein
VSLPIIDSGPSERGWSYFAAFLRCPMLFFWKYVYAKRNALGWNDTTAPLARGTLVHVGLGHYYARKWAQENGRDPDRILAPLEAMRMKAEMIGDVGQEMLPVATSMVEAYWKRYPTDSFKVVAIEEPLFTHFFGAYYTARLDRVVQERDGKIYIHDIKTTARMESKTQRKYTLHGQFFGQHFLGMKAYGDRFGGVIIDIIDESGKCERTRPLPAPFMLRTFPQRIERTHARIQETIARCGVDQEKWAAEAATDEQICFGPYGQCPAFEICRWGRSE